MCSYVTDICSRHLGQKVGRVGEGRARAFMDGPGYLHCKQNCLLFGLSD